VLAVALLASSAGGVDTLDAHALATAGLASSSGLACLALGGALLVRRPVARTLLTQPSARSLGPGALALAMAGLLGISQLIDLALDLTGALEGSQLATLDGILATATGVEVPLLVLGLAVAPALGEELLFRGLLLTTLARRLGPAGALVVTSLLFGASHMELTHGAAATVLGLYLGSLVLMTGTLRVAILCHGANNLVAVVAPILGSAVGESVAWQTLAAMLLAGCVLALIVTLRRLSNDLPRALPRWAEGGDGRDDE
jgi:membrane protease YdiL (CAAX protease family)